MCAKKTSQQKKKILDRSEKMNAVPMNLLLEDPYVKKESTEDAIQIHMMQEIDFDSTNISEIINNIQ